ncbi:unnamed protein product [Ilex paraguariensis]|uniref:Pentatricopeptide repeat-containing protein n=1 Tax=Ilex paraguariensis TaxID=185542 RepID=A0ABC8RIE9_9AQUA
MKLPFEIFLICFVQTMLILLRGLLLRNSKRVSVFLSTGPNNIYCCLSNGSQFVSPSSHTFLLWITGFLCFFRYPFVTKVNFDSFHEVFNRDVVSNIVREDKWDDFRIVSVFESALAPILVSRILVELKGEPRLALKLFKWAKRHTGFCHTTESYCILAHILFCSRMCIDAHAILKDLVSSNRVLLGGDIFDILWSTRNVCVPGYGVFDTLFSVLVELGMLEEASECFLRMKRFRVLPKVRSCNYLLHTLSKTGRGELSRKFFKDIIGAGICPSVFTYNIMIDYACKEGDFETARSLFAQMKEMGVTPDIVTYNSLIDGMGSLGSYRFQCLYMRK